MVTPSASATMTTSRHILLRSTRNAGSTTMVPSRFSHAPRDDKSNFATSVTSQNNQHRLYHVLVKSSSYNKGVLQSARAPPRSFKLECSQISPTLSSPHRAFSSANKRDFYDVLGVDKKADKGAIKKAYFQMAKQYHPDTNPDNKDAAEKFKEVTEAYEVLSDDKQRELYDQFGHAGVDPNFQGGNPFGGGNGQNPFAGFDFGDGSFHFSTSGGGANQIDPEELFDAFFGGGRRRPRGPRRGADLQMHVKLSFKEAVFGSSQDLNLRYQIVNSATGKVEYKERVVSVDTPPGIDHGMNLRLSGQGAEGDPGAPRGNLLVQVIVEDDSYFQRDGADVHTEIPISVTQAILGGTVDVETLDGQVEVKIPKGCQPDTKLLLRGKGIQKLHSSSKGSQIVHLKIEIPDEITRRQEELLREFDEETSSTGKGISGRLAQAAGSAFEKIFGSTGQKSDSPKAKGGSKHDDDEEDGVDDEKKAAAQ